MIQQIILGNKHKYRYMMKFNDFDWHDSIIKNISIDRSMPGIKDDIKFDIECVNGNRIELLFEEIYWVNMVLNFGIVADETILSANVEDANDSDLIELYSKWNGFLDDIILKSYTIRLNSTGGIIKVISKGFKINKNS